MADSMPSELDQLRRENARLIALLEDHGVAWRSSGPAPTEPAPISVHPSAHAPLSPEEKVALFRRLFRGRDNVYALRWQSNSSGRSGYAPACGNEWRPGICEKPRWFAVIASTACSFPSPMRRSTVIWPLTTPLASTPWWGTTAATC